MNAMNENTPPIDAAIRDQLARRSAGRLPEGLLTEVTTALDMAPAPRAASGWPRFTWTAPRLAGTAVAVAFVAIFLAAIALPGWRTGPAATSGVNPAGYPAERAMTTAELAAVMAGPALATNTTLVAAVTIDARTDVCPMNRYPTIGVIEGMGSQVCVMGATLAQDLSGPTVLGTYAFRYLAPGYLGYLGQITPAALQLSYGVSEDWPLAGKTFLVDGWLGGTSLLCIASTVAPAGDPLNPNGGDGPCMWSWLSDDGKPPIGSKYGDVETPVASGAPIDSPVPSTYTMALMGSARYVEAGGARQIDSLPLQNTRGVYVVRSVTEGCAGDPVTSSRGCGAWRVLAKVSDITIPGPDATVSAEPSTPLSATPSAPETPIANPSVFPQSSPTATGFAETVRETGLIGSANEPLTPAQLAALIAADPNHLSGRYVIDQRTVCDGTGDCTGNPVETVADLVQSDGSLTLIGRLASASGGGIVLPVGEVPLVPKGMSFFLVDGWLARAPLDACDAVGQPCDKVSTIGSSPNSYQLIAPDSAASLFQSPGTAAGATTRGLFLVELSSPATASCTSSATPSAGQCYIEVKILARLETATLP